MPDSELDQITKKIYMGVFFAIVSGFGSAIITAILVRNKFATEEKQIHIVQQTCSTGVVAYVLALQSQHF